VPAPVSDLLSQLLRPDNLHSAEELQGKSSPAPAKRGVYAWFFKDAMWPFSTEGCAHNDGLPLLYLGIAPARVDGRSSLRSRLRTHSRGNSDASTLRMTLGCVLSEQLGIRLQRSKSGRYRFGPGERVLTDWLARHAFVSWVACDEPWIAEPLLIAQLDLPLNLQHNGTHAFFPTLQAARRAARLRANLDAGRTVEN